MLLAYHFMPVHPLRQQQHAHKEPMDSGYPMPPAAFCWACAKAGAQLGHLQLSRMMQTGCVLINNVHSHFTGILICTFNCLAHFRNHLSQHKKFAWDSCYHIHHLWSQFFAQTGFMPFLMKLIFSPSSDFSFHSLLLTIHPAFIIILQKYSTKKTNLKHLGGDHA